ncbi:hypothetical protein LTS12_029623 [Elasticomyces elasticus]|nr:hypothetical protein LTS12_029623 [Elasticomyces elasticus]
MEAHESLEYFRCKAAREFRDKITNEPGAETSDAYVGLIKQYEPILRNWCTALDTFENTRGQSLTMRDETGLKILKIHQYMHIILLEYIKLGVTDRSVWDTYDPLFERIVDLAADVVNASHGVDCLSLSPSELEELSQEGRLRPSFTLDMGFIGPVFNVAMLCRHPGIRHKAVTILRCASRQEGCFNSHVYAVVAEETIAEEAVSQDKEVSLLKLLPELRRYEPGRAQVSVCSKVDAVEKVYMKLGQRGVKIDVPLPAMTVMADLVGL